MAQYIDKDAVVAEIYKLKKSHDNWSCMGKSFHQDYETLLSFIDTLEVKESSLEKKAKAYDKAIAHAKKILKIIGNATLGNLVLKNEFENMFPSLKESEEDKLREQVVYAINQLHVCECTQNKLLSWLEKQAKKDEEILILKDKIESLHAAIIAIKETHKIELEKQGEKKSIDDLTQQEAMDIAVAKCFEQGEQNPTDKVEPKFNVGDVMRTLQEATNNITSGLPVVVSIDNEYYHCTNELIAIKDQNNYEYPPINRIQKPAWSEEDECTLNGILDDYKSMCKTYRNWLESLKNRIQPQQKQEWSEEDDYLIWAISLIIKGYPKQEGFYGYSKEKLISWLKSLKDRYTWKPSEQDILLLERIANGKANPQDFQASLAALIVQLKKLMEE